MSLLARITLFSSILLLLCSCQTPLCKPQPAVQHIVLCWLKKPGNTQARAQIIAAVKDFKTQIPQLKSLRIGQVLPSDRPIVDDSFDVAFVMTFANEAHMKTYEKHPAHQKAVKDILRPLTAKILVYDFKSE
jgi:hypothetical protein